MITSKKLLVYLIPISLIGCASTREDHGSVLMEDVVVQRTTVRSTTQNPSTSKGGTVFIQGDNINIGTLIVNSPNARVDNSVNTVQVQQNFQQPATSDFRSRLYYNSDNGLYGPAVTSSKPKQPDYHADRDFFKKISPHIITIIPNILMMR